MHLAKPQKDNSDNRAFIIAEIGFLLFTIMVYITGLVSISDVGREYLGMASMGMMGLMFAGCWANYLIKAIPSLVQTLKKKCAKKNTYTRKHTKST